MSQGSDYLKVMPVLRFRFFSTLSGSTEKGINTHTALDPCGVARRILEFSD